MPILTSIHDFSHNPSGHSSRRRGRAIGAVLGLGLGTLALASSALQAAGTDAATIDLIVAELQGADVAASEPKGMRVVSGRAAELSVEIEPLQTRYEVDEPIRFRVRGDNAFYVYLYSIDEDTGESEMIFPNELERDNHFPAGRPYLIPNRDAEFYADRPGTEEVVMVASRNEIDVPPAAVASKGKAVLKLSDFERLLTAQGISVERDDRARLRDARTDDMLVKHLELEVTGEQRRGETPAETPTVLVGTAHDSYHAGERFQVMFGADTDGYIHLYAVEPGGAYERLAREEVKADRLESASFRAEAPYGSHKLVAVYSPDRQLDRRTETDILGDDGAIWMPNSGPIGVAVQRIRILR